MLYGFDFDFICHVQPLVAHELKILFYFIFLFLKQYVYQVTKRIVQTETGYYDRIIVTIMTRIHLFVGTLAGGKVLLLRGLTFTNIKTFCSTSGIHARLTGVQFNTPEACRG